MKLKLKKEIIENKNLSNNAIVSYLGVVACTRNEFDCIFTNKNMINYYLTNKVTATRHFDDSIRNGLIELFDKHVIICKNKTGTDYYLNDDNLKLKPEDKFVFVDIEDIQKILNCNYKGKLYLLRFYICLLSTFLSKNRILDIRDPEKYNNILGMMSQEYLAYLSGVSVHSVVEYVKLLEELKIIYVYRCSFMFRDAFGNIKRHNNIYGKYKDRDIIDEFAKVKYEMYDDLHKIKFEKTVNTYRSLMQKYNCLIKGKKYDEKTIDDIFRYIVEYNNKNPDKEKDLSVFESYGYTIN